MELEKYIGRYVSFLHHSKHYEGILDAANSKIITVRLSNYGFNRRKDHRIHFPTLQVDKLIIK